MNSNLIDEKIQFYTAKLDATRRQLDVSKTSFFKAKTATTKIKWPNKPPTEKMRLLLRIVSAIPVIRNRKNFLCNISFSHSQCYGINANTTKP